MKIYVSGKAEVTGNGTQAAPFKTIQEAANIAMPGDEIIVLPGIYREHVNPIHAGREEARIVYRSEVPLGAVITGAEEIKGWEQVEGTTVWKKKIANSFFGEYNPYTTLVSGDWFIAYFVAHTGEVYLNEQSMYEVETIEGVYTPVKSRIAWEPEFSLYTWYTEQNAEKDCTVIYANFHEFDPNKENVEINVRQFGFYPLAEGIGHITLDGFKVSKAATQWAPPTAYQVGMVGPHWSKGWIIENCEICDSKCSGISLGMYLQPNNDNKWLHAKYKDGTQTERDCICQAQVEGWSKENIGSHKILNCNIHHCGQTGIVGHLGGVFSIIEGNHIHHINNKQNLAGAEIGGIKMHAAIDVIIARNHIDHCTRGLWLDWQAQGTRVTGNLFHDNALPYDHLMIDEAMHALGEDIFVEVSHGPTLIDHNLLLSERSLKLPTQGVALAHNLIAGSMAAVGIGVDNGTISIKSPRYTPYHMKHRTEIAGFMTILHGDMRFYNNIFLQQPIREKLLEKERTVSDLTWEDFNIHCGTFPYENYPLWEEWNAMFEGYCGMGSPASDRYYSALPVWFGGNVYLNGAKPCSKETDALVLSEPAEFTLKETEEGIVFSTNLYHFLHTPSTSRVTTERLGCAFEPEQAYEQPDGSPIVMDTDYLGSARSEQPMPGPFEHFEDRQLVFPRSAC